VPGQPVQGQSAPGQPAPGQSVEEPATVAWASPDTAWAAPDQQAQPPEATGWEGAAWSSYPATHPPPSGQLREGQLRDGQPRDGQPRDGQPRDGQPRDGQPRDGQLRDGQLRDGQPGYGRPYDGQPYDGQPQVGQPQVGQPEYGHAYDGQPYDGQAYDGQRYGQPRYGQTYGAQPNGEQSYGTQSYGTQSYGTQSYGAQSYGTQSYGTQDDLAQDGFSDDGQSGGAEHARPRRQVSLRLVLISLAALLGVAGLVASLAGVAVQLMPRTFSSSQQRQIMTWEIAARWRTWQVGKIFPAAIKYQLPAGVLDASSGLPLTARRVGVAPQSTCQAAIDPALADVLDHDGCLAVLRATYVDSSDSFAITVGIAVLRTQAPAAKRLPVGPGLAPGVRAAAFAGTLAARFGDRQRQLNHAVSDGPYLIMYTAGYTDGRPRDTVTANPYADNEMISVAGGIATSVGKSIGALPPVPKCPGAPGC
jgi:hypothetical protein